MELSPSLAEAEWSKSLLSGDPWESRTPVCGVRGRRLDHLTNGPSSSQAPHLALPPTDESSLASLLPLFAPAPLPLGSAANLAPAAQAPYPPVLFRVNPSSTRKRTLVHLQGLEPWTP